MKIAIVTHGRFVAFDYARELLRQGHDVHLFTNYPLWYVEKWGIPRASAHTFVHHGIVGRAIRKVGQYVDVPASDALLHSWFGRLAARALEGTAWDVVICLSGVGEETFRNPKVSGLKLCARFSAHIRVQDRLLEEEQTRTSLPIERPSPWIVAREQREYALADLVLVPSTFVLNSFVTEGIPRERVIMVPFGVDPDVFRASPAAVDERCRRLVSGEALRIAYTGTISLRKGMWDFLEMCRSLAGSRFTFDLTGAVHRDARAIAGEIGRYATIHPPVPQAELPASYAAADVYVFPTIEDGHPYVLSQALGAALPIICSENCSAPDIITNGVTGWVLPARRPDLFIERLQWCDANRERLAAMVRDAHAQLKPRTWTDSVSELTTQLAAALRARKVRVA